MCNGLNPLPNGNILDWSKLEAFADEKINVAEIIISLSDGIQNIVGKAENTGYQHSPLPTMLSKALFFKVVKSQNCVVELKKT